MDPLLGLHEEEILVTDQAEISALWAGSAYSGPLSGVLLARRSVLTMDVVTLLGRVRYEAPSSGKGFRRLVTRGSLRLLERGCLRSLSMRVDLDVTVRQYVRTLLFKSIPEALPHDRRVSDPRVSSLESYALEQRHSLRHLQRACRAGGLASPTSLRSVFRTKAALELRLLGLTWAEIAPRAVQCVGGFPGGHYGRGSAEGARGRVGSRAVAGSAPAVGGGRGTAGFREVRVILRGMSVIRSHCVTFGRVSYGLVAFRYGEGVMVVGNLGLLALGDG
jgi:hypothetical protein